MCLSPIFIKNKSLLHNCGLKNLQVPCGHCEECRRVKSMDYFIRAYAEYRHSVMNGEWCAFFSTLTFNEENCPRSDFYRYDIDSKTWTCEHRNVRCFNHVLLKRFLKSYTQFYRRLYPDDYVWKTRSDGKKVRVYTKVPKILVTCEFGEKENGTHRPHYHVFFCIPRRMTYKEFKVEIEKFWHYGFTKNIAIKCVDGVYQDRDPINCIRYITKYITKGSGYLPEPYKNCKTLVPSLDEWFNLDIRVFTTNNFGASFEKLLSDDNYRLNTLTLCVGSTYQSFKIPAYYRRRYYSQDVILATHKYLVAPIDYPFRQVKARKRISRVSYTQHINGYSELSKKNIQDSAHIKFYNVMKNIETHNYDFYRYLASNFEMFDHETILINGNKYSISGVTPERFVELFMRFNWQDRPLLDIDSLTTSIETQSLVSQSYWYVYGLVKLADRGVITYSELLDRFHLIPELADSFVGLPNYIKSLESVSDYVHPAVLTSYEYHTLQSCLVFCNAYDDFERCMRRDVLEFNKKKELEYYKNHNVKKC